MSLAIRLMAEPVRQLAAGDLGAAYSTIGTSMNHPIRMIVIQNFMDVGVMLSFDGINDHMPMVTNGYMLLDITSNKTLTQGFFVPEGQYIYAKQLGGVPSTGSIYLTVFYGAEV